MERINYTVLNKTIKSLNEIKDDVKDIDYIIDIATDDLKAQAKFDELREQRYS